MPSTSPAVGCKKIECRIHALFSVATHAQIGTGCSFHPAGIYLSSLIHYSHITGIMTPTLVSSRAVAGRCRLRSTERCFRNASMWYASDPGCDMAELLATPFGDNIIHIHSSIPCKPFLSREKFHCRVCTNWVRALPTFCRARPRPFFRFIYELKGAWTLF